MVLDPEHCVLSLPRSLSCPAQACLHRHSEPDIQENGDGRGSDGLPASSQGPCRPTGSRQLHHHTPAGGKLSPLLTSRKVCKVSRSEPKRLEEGLGVPRDGQCSSPWSSPDFVHPSSGAEPTWVLPSPWTCLALACDVMSGFTLPASSCAQNPSGSRSSSVPGKQSKTETNWSVSNWWV